MLDAICVIYVKNAKNAIFDAYAIRHMSNIDMAIWVSKNASGPLECRPIPINNFWIRLTSWNVKILTFKIFLCIFRNFLCIMKGPRGRASNWARELKFYWLNFLKYDIFGCGSFGCIATDAFFDTHIAISRYDTSRMVYTSNMVLCAYLPLMPHLASNICHPTFVISIYGNMGVKRCVRSSEM